MKHGTYNPATQSKYASCECHPGWSGLNCEIGNAFIACDGMFADCKNQSQPMANLFKYIVFHSILSRFGMMANIRLETT